MYENTNSEVYLRCDYSRFVTTDSEVEVQWLKGRTILRLDEFKHGKEEAGLSSKHVKELRLDPQGWALNDGVYACHIHIDGTYINTNAWGLSYHFTHIEGTFRSFRVSMNNAFHTVNTAVCLHIFSKSNTGID